MTSPVTSVIGPPGGDTRRWVSGRGQSVGQLLIVFGVSVGKLLLQGGQPLTAAHSHDVGAEACARQVWNSQPCSDSAGD